MASNTALSIETLCVAGSDASRVDGSAVMPIFQSATFLTTGEEVGYDAVRYTRCNNNPSQVVLGEKLAELEGTEAALPLSSGMAAICSTLLTLLKAGDHMLIQGAAYGGTYDLVHKELKELGITASMVDISQPCHTWGHHVQHNTKVVYVEAISNPLMQVPDLPGVVAFAKQHGLTSVIDATFVTPVLLRPAAQLGFDLVIHSATKYLNGHSDIIAGVVAGSKQQISKICSKANHYGGSLDPHAAFLLLRGLKTLALRVERQSANAAALAAALERHPLVKCVHYPGLASHPRHDLVQELFSGKGAGGMVAFEVKDGAAADAVLKHVQLPLVAPSLGGVETLVTRPVLTTHVGLSAAEREAIGIFDGLIRVSVGIEGVDDLLQDFLGALDAAAAEVAV